MAIRVESLMRYVLRFVLTLSALILPALVAAQNAPAEKRIALVIGNAGYQAGALNTPANDAGLIAQTLQAAGFDVVGARDLDQDSLRRALRDFLDKAQDAGPQTVAFVYLSGYGLQLEGENYFAPVDARIARDSGVAAEAIRLSDYTRPLAALGLKASIVVLDAARANPFARSGPPLAGGLALVEPEPGMLIAFNATAGTIAPESQGAYGPYAQALAEMMREGGLPLAEVFDRVRLRVNDVTKGALVPWHASRVEARFVFFERAPDAPPPVASPEQSAAMRARPIGDLGAQEAYIVALERDTVAGYQDFIAAYPRDPLAARVRALLGARREAITWRRTRLTDTPAAYWSYLRRYPRGPHAADARRRLAILSAALEPPRSFTVIEYDVPRPPPDEIVYVERPVLVFDDPVFAFAPPPPPPVILLPPPPPEFIVLPPPPPPIEIFVLPMPVYRPVPVYVRPPVYVAPPPDNVIFNNVHNNVIINNTTKTVTITERSGQTKTISPGGQPAATPPTDRDTIASPPGQRAPPTAAAPVPAAALLGPALPPSVARKAIQTQPQQGPDTQPGAPAQPPTLQPGQAPQPGRQRPPLGQPLPGTAIAPTTPPAPLPQTTTPPAARPPTATLPTTTPPTGPTTAPTTPPPAARPPAATAPTPPSTQPSPPAPPAAAGHPPPAPPPAATRAPAAPAPAATPPAPPTAATRAPPPPPVAARPPPPPPSPPPAATRAPPPLPPAATRPPPPPPVAARPPPPPPSPPPAATRAPPPPPPAATRPPPPPPPAAAHAPPPPPPAAARPPPPPPPPAAVRPPSPPPPAAARASPKPPPNCGGPGQPPCPKQ